MTAEAYDNLKNVAVSVLAAYDHAYPDHQIGSVDGLFFCFGHFGDLPLT